MPKRTIALTQRPLLRNEDAVARQLLSNVKANAVGPQTIKRQAIGFKHWNADGKFSHTSMGTKFRRYGTWK